MNIAYALYLVAQTLVLWAGLSVILIALLRAIDAIGIYRGWWS